MGHDISDAEANDSNAEEWSFVAKGKGKMDQSELSLRLQYAPGILASVKAHRSCCSPSIHSPRLGNSLMAVKHSLIGIILYFISISLSHHHFKYHRSIFS